MDGIHIGIPMIRRIRGFKLISRLVQYVWRTTRWNLIREIVIRSVIEFWRAQRMEGHGTSWTGARWTNLLVHQGFGYILSRHFAISDTFGCVRQARIAATKVASSWRISNCSGWFRISKQQGPEHIFAAFVQQFDRILWTRIFTKGSSKYPMGGGPVWQRLNV
jgi:hypothetical protein